MRLVLLYDFEDFLLLVALASGTKTLALQIKWRGFAHDTKLLASGAVVPDKLCSSYGQSQAWLAGLAEPRDYVQKRVSSYDRSGENQDYKRLSLEAPSPSWTNQDPESLHISGLRLRLTRCTT